jgi:hypothetical protein
MNIRHGLRRLGSALRSRSRPQAVSDSAEYIDFEAFRRDLLSKNPDPEYRKGIEPLLQELRQKFGNRIPVNELYRFIADERVELKTRMKGIVEKARDEGKTVELEQLRQHYEKQKAEYTGQDPGVFSRELDREVEELRAQFGEQIPFAEFFKRLQDLERATGDTDTINQFPLSEWSAHPGFHERKLLIRHNNVYFPPGRRGISENELLFAQDTDVQMFERFEEAAHITIGFLLSLKNRSLPFDELDKLRDGVDLNIDSGSGLGTRAHDLLKTLKAGCDAIDTLMENALIQFHTDEASGSAIKQNLSERQILHSIKRHQAYIDVTRAAPDDMLPTLLSCSVEDLRFLFQDLPPALSRVSAVWRKTKAGLRAFAIQLMNENPDARAKLLQEPDKLELLGIDISPRRYLGIQHCPSCGVRVLPTSDGRCPSCRNIIVTS